MVTIEDSDAYMSDLESNPYEDDDGSFMMDDEEEIMAPMAKKKLTLKGKKAASTNKKKHPILSPRSEGAGNIPSAVTTDGATKKKAKTIEETYQKKTPHEHVLCRPDTYVGSVEPMTEKMFVYDHDQEAIVNKTITYTPGLFKIFDESKLILSRLLRPASCNPEGVCNDEWYKWKIKTNFLCFLL